MPWVDQSQEYVLVAYRDDVRVGIWSGRAGDGWIAGAPFVVSHELAVAKAKQFNASTPLHGLTFRVKRWREAAPVSEGMTANGPACRKCGGAIWMCGCVYANGDEA